jgi:hypothetical protein
VKRAEKAMLADAQGARRDQLPRWWRTPMSAKVSIVGIGMRSHAGVAAKMFQTLRDEGINIKVITTSEIKVSVLIDRKYMELAVQALHDALWTWPNLSRARSGSDEPHHASDRQEARLTRSMGTEVCSIYLLRDADTLELCATEGLRPRPCT